MLHSDVHLFRFRPNYYNVTLSQSCVRFTWLVGLPRTSEKVPGSRLRREEIRLLKNMPKMISDPSIYSVFENHALGDFENGQYLRFWPHLKMRGSVCAGVPGSSRSAAVMLRVIEQRVRQRGGKSPIFIKPAASYLILF